MISKTTAALFPIPKTGNRSSRKIRYKYKLVNFRNDRHRTDVLLSDSNCNLEILREGMMLTGNFSESLSAIPLMKNEIKSIKLIRGKETIDTFLLSPMHILLKLGVPTSISRYVRMYPSEYKITETRMIITCEHQQLILITGGNRFERILKSLKSDGYADFLKVDKKPVINMLNYSAY